MIILPGAKNRRDNAISFSGISSDCKGVHTNRNLTFIGRSCPYTDLCDDSYHGALTLSERKLIRDIGFVMMKTF